MTTSTPDPLSFFFCYATEHAKLYNSHVNWSWNRPYQPTPGAPVCLFDIWAHSKLNFPKAICWGKALDPVPMNLATSWKSSIISKVYSSTKLLSTKARPQASLKPAGMLVLSTRSYLDTSNSDRSMRFEAGSSISEEKASSEPTEKQLSTSIGEHGNMGGNFHQWGMSEALLESNKTTKLNLWGWMGDHKRGATSCKIGLVGVTPEPEQAKFKLGWGPASKLEIVPLIVCRSQNAKHICGNPENTFVLSSPCLPRKPTAPLRRSGLDPWQPRHLAVQLWAPRELNGSFRWNGSIDQSPGRLEIIRCKLPGVVNPPYSGQLQFVNLKAPLPPIPSFANVPFPSEWVRGKHLNGGTEDLKLKCRLLDQGSRYIHNASMCYVYV